MPFCSMHIVLHAKVTNVVKTQFLEGQVASGKGRFVSLVVLCQLCRHKNLIARDTTFLNDGINRGPLASSSLLKSWEHKRSKKIILMQE